MEKIGILADNIFMEHRTGAHVESPDRLRVIYDMLEEEKYYDSSTRIELRRATDEEIVLNHDEAYIHMLESTGPGNLDSDTVLSERSLEVARLAVGGCLNMVDEIMSGRIVKGFAFVRPPGHHAEKERGMGFCLFNNIAIAARHLMKEHGLQRIAIIDWDLHHGNGTEHSFYSEKGLLYLSMHQSPCYPGTGGLRDVGTGEGEGFNVNLPIAAGAGDAEYLKAFDELFLPIMERYRPEIILVSAGFDTHRLDPLGAMELSAAGFGAMGQRLSELAGQVCGGKIGFFLEGGYSLEGLKESVSELLYAITGEKAYDLPPSGDTSIDELLGIAKLVQERYWGSL
ncbi:MAG: histone deacetylase [Proteobacteria bacterium]|nr:histone deacetylase [Pseudomonadota bacterium]